MSDSLDLPNDEYRRWICDACGFIYDEAKGDPDSGLAPGTRYADIPDDWACPLCGLRKADLRLLSDAPEVPVAAAGTAPRPASGARGAKGGEDYVVIVGGGIAGWSVAEAIRQRDPQKPVLLVSACEASVYPKPALSMAFAQGKTAEELIDKDAATRAAELDIEILTSTRILRLDTARKRLTTAKGGIRYDKLVLALGASQRTLPVGGDAADTVQRVNDLHTYMALRKRLDTARHVTILGAGLIGCEFAEDLTSGGYHVTVIDPAGRPLAGLLPAPIAEDLRKRLADKGVTWQLGSVLESLDKKDDGLEASLSNGERFETDVVLSAAGLVPNTALAAKAGIGTAQGIVTDAHMRSSVADVYAVGDCAEVCGQVYAYIEPIRRQAATIAADLAGEDTPFRVQPPLVRIKTPSLPLAVCPAPRGAEDRWEAVAGSDGDWRLEYRSDGQLKAFALSGSHVPDSADLYRSMTA